MKNDLNIVLVQLDIQWEAPQENMAKVEKLLSAAELENADAVVLPEMFSTGFTMNPTGAATPRRGAVVQWMKRLAKSRRLFVIASHAESRKGQYFNAALAVAPNGKIAAAYDKIHLYGEERDHYERGGNVVTFDMGDVKAAAFICYDLRFPEVFRDAAGQGARVFFVLANWPASRQRHWEILLRARALENQAYVCAVNRTGGDPDAAYAGGSCVISPEGEYIIDLGDKERAASASLDMDALSRFRNRFNFLRDMR